MRKIVLCLVTLLFLGACAPAMPRDQVAQVLRDNPQLVFDALKRDKAQLVDVLNAAVQERDSQDRLDSIAQGLANPLKPELAAGRPFWGAADAPVTIVEYSDFLCGYCAQGASTMQELLRRRSGQVRLYFKHFPVRPGSLEPAVMFEALAMQDQAVAWKFGELAFANQQALADGSGKGVAALLTSAAAGAKIDQVRLKKDMESPAMRARIEADVAEAKRFGVEGTPTFVVNGVLVRGALSIGEFEELLGLVMPKK